MDASKVAFVILPGDEDPAAFMKRGALEVKWNTGSEVRSVSGAKLQESRKPRVVDKDLLLPTLYLHFLDTEFQVRQQQLDLALASGNNNSELNIALPAGYEPGMRGYPTGSLGEHLTRVLRFLREQGEVPVEAARMKPGGFGPRTKFTSSADASRAFFSMKTARPKAAITLDKAAFGIPQSAELYLFVQNHSSVAFMDDEEKESVEACIEELPEMGGQWAKLAIFLKVYYEGGFGYNEKRQTGTNSYLPINVGIASMSVVQAFEGQAGIGTGYPFLVPAGFTPFADTVPVTIRAISEMSSRHKRYGLCFTRLVMVWAGEDFERNGVLNYSLVTPHGGFFYIPSGLKEHRCLGGLIYAFGEAPADCETPETSVATVDTAGTASTPGSRDRMVAAEVSDRRVCTICLEADAVMAAVPCGHLAYCEACAQDKHPERDVRRRPCPVCRGNVRDVFRIY